jgi:hypothetical protein
MSLLGKIFVVINLILALVFLGVTSALHYSQNDWRLAAETNHQRYQKVVEAKNAEIAAHKGTIETLQRSNDSLTAQNTTLRDNIKQREDTLTAKGEEFNKARSDLEALQSTNKSLIDANTAKDSEIKDVRASLDRVTGEMNVALGNKETAESQVARLVQQKAALEKDLGEVRKSYSDTKQQLLDMNLAMEELQRQGIPVDTLLVNHRPLPPINGKVAGVKSDVQPALVLITVGKDDKVEKGYPFTVYRGAEFIAKVIVEKVNADSAGCRVLFNAPGKTIKAGDDVATRVD